MKWKRLSKGWYIVLDENNDLKWTVMHKPHMRGWILVRRESICHMGIYPTLKSAKEVAEFIEEREVR